MSPAVDAPRTVDTPARAVDTPAWPVESASPRADTRTRSVGPAAPTADTPAREVGSAAPAVDTPAWEVDTPAQGVGSAAHGVDTPSATGRARPLTDPVSDTGPIGLRMFNLGTIPASVTPPRSWRRAAWFTVAASVAALAGLLILGALLVGPTRDTDQITSMPYFPDGSPLATIGDGPDDLSGTVDPTPGSQRSAVLPAASSSDADAGPTTRSWTWPNSHHPAPTRRKAPSTPPPVVGTLPDVPTVTTVGDPVVDPAKLIRRTQTFFAEVTTNAKAAADLTTGTLHDDATALIRQKYGDISSIQIQSISLDPTTGLAISVLRLANKDGTTQTQRTTLQFTLSGDPKITNPGG
ncbi:MAG TPA: hypothetical protein VFX16_24865 [Pseudonocardiaceae bacterium]|nr:hypothetical protein [Pseudonocardiaceae bacterium]